MINKEHLELHACIMEVIASFTQKFGKQVKYEGPDSGFTILGDMEKLQSVLENLFLNSIEAGANNINVRASRNDTAITVQIEDNGKGCNKETLWICFSRHFLPQKKARKGQAWAYPLRKPL